MSPCSSALVATVVPCANAATSSGVAPDRARICVTPRDKPTAGLCGVLATLVTSTAPLAASTDTMSVNVPPVSMPMRIMWLRRILAPLRLWEHRPQQVLHSDDCCSDAEGNAMTTVSVFGGTGFLGRRVVQRLAAEGATLRIAVRSPDRARSVFRAADLERVTVLRADVRDQTSVTAAVAGVDAVVNVVSAYVEKPGATSESVHEKGAQTLAQEAARAGVARLVLVSGIGADPESRSPYIRVRGRGELAVRQAFPSATIVRP